MIGGLVVSFISGSQLAVSGPAAGLTTVVAASMVSLGDYRIFLLAVIVAGLLQLILGVLKLGAVAYYFPSAVIKGMLAAIGIILISKQIPIASGIRSAGFLDEWLCSTFFREKFLWQFQKLQPTYEQGCNSHYRRLTDRADHLATSIFQKAENSSCTARSRGDRRDHQYHFYKCCFEILTQTNAVGQYPIRYIQQHCFA
jgi:hypothetical protein